MKKEVRNFYDFSTAFDYCRECNKPVVVVIKDIGKYKLYPSGRAEKK